jgi:iron complex transport system substrate-binding protein
MNLKKKAKPLALTLIITLLITIAAGCGGLSTTTSTTSTTLASDENQTTTEATSSVSSEETSSSAETTESQSAQAITLIDMKDREFQLDKTADKIVALTAADCEIIYALGAGDTLIGRGEYCNYPEEVLDVPSVSSGSETNIEQVIALEPEVIIMGTMDQTTEQIEDFENAGIPVIVTDAQSIEDTYTAIELIGAVTGHQKQAADLAAKMQSDFAEIARLAQEKKAEDSKSIYFEVSPLEFGLWAAGSNTFMDEITAMLGLENTFADVKMWGEVSQEQVIERNPDYIVTITMYFGEGPLPVDEIMSRPGWSEISAVKNKLVFNADSDQLSRPGPRLADGAKALYDFVYGQ